jgi:hypothetical protein
MYVCCRYALIIFLSKVEALSFIKVEKILQSKNTDTNSTEVSDLSYGHNQDQKNDQ